MNETRDMNANKRSRHPKLLKLFGVLQERASLRQSRVWIADSAETHCVHRQTSIGAFARSAAHPVAYAEIENGQQ